MQENPSGLLIHRLAATIVDESLPLKEVEKELRGSVAELAVKKRGLGKRETANRCGVTQKSIENYLREARSSPRSPEREIARLLEDDPLTLEEIHEKVSPPLSHGRHFGLDDAKRSLEKLVRNGEVEALPGKKYGACKRSFPCRPCTAEVYRELVDRNARDLDAIILSQKEITDSDFTSRNKNSRRFSRVVGNTNLVEVDLTVSVPKEKLGEFYETLSQDIERLTLQYEKKNGATGIRLILAMRVV